MKTIRILRALPATALIVLASCGGGDPMREPIDGAARAVEKRNAEAVVGFLSPTYRDQQGWGPRDVEAAVLRYLAGYENLKVEVTRLTIEPGGATARARFRAELSGTPRRVPGLEGWLPRTSSWSFDVELAQEDGRWKIAGASWKQDR